MRSRRRNPNITRREDEDSTVITWLLFLAIGVLALAQLTNPANPSGPH
jgi:hypothetical protein